MTQHITKAQAIAAARDFYERRKLGLILLTLNLRLADPSPIFPRAEVKIAFAEPVGDEPVRIDSIMARDAEGWFPLATDPRALAWLGKELRVDLIRWRRVG